MKESSKCTIRYESIHYQKGYKARNFNRQSVSFHITWEDAVTGIYNRTALLSQN